MTDGVDLSTVLSTFSGSGDLAERLGSLLGGDAAAKLGEALGNEALGAKLADTLKNADLSSIVSALGGSSGSPSSGDADGGSAKVAAEQAAPALPAIFGSLGGARAMSKERRGLLAALKPFVGERRRRAIDMLLGFDRLTAFLPGGK